jgi:vacuolar-type H+-ATPase subunit H
MKQMTISCIFAAFIGLGLTSVAYAADPASTVQQVKDKAGEVITNVSEKASQLGQQAKEQATQLVNQAGEQATQLANQAGEQLEAAKQQTQAKFNEGVQAVENSQQAKEVTAGLLQWIYVLAGWLAFPAFYWVVFILMIVGVVSWTGQVVIAKLVVAGNKGSFDLKETISDSIVLAISVFGLVLTTQAAAQNSTFTQSPAMVLSATVVGAAIGLVLYFWGQALEMKQANTAKPL